MSAIECPICGGEFPSPEGEGGERVAVTCQYCGSQLKISIPSDAGAETLFQPQLLAEDITDEQEGSVGGGTAGDTPTPSVGSGTVLLDTQKPQPASSRLETAVQGFLILAHAMPGEERLPLVGAKTVVGREGADIVIGDRALSSRHFEVEAKGHEFFIRDLDSSNGTLVNGDRVRARQLASGDKIQAGRTTFFFRTLKVVPFRGSK